MVRSKYILCKKESSEKILLKYGAFKNTFCVRKRPFRGEGQLEPGVSDVSACLNKLQYIALQLRASRS